MIQEAFTYVEQMPDLETKLKLIDTLRTVTAGKVKLSIRFFTCCSYLRATNIVTLTTQINIFAFYNINFSETP